ncbi:MAG: diaminopimelate epimerase [Paludibacter sp. 47-17]|jgi:diaminopimelate epimerase|nr:MAG: diaminopimelate epimerase [Paludibacter sp. SCN 50-10]OJX91770.1 MAG: diaminopimelate epimerase [Paludibacter sp. 47-17]
MKFTKMHGTGNDYIYVNGFKEQIDNPEETARKWSDRHTGIGSDGLVLILPSETCDFRMRMFNADGSESEMCGNASRCIGKYVYDKGLTRKTTVTLETKAGVKTLKLFPDKTTGKVESVTVDMGEPKLQAGLIPVLTEYDELINRPLQFGKNLKYNVTAVSMGNPHAVIFTDKIHLIDLEATGPIIENSAVFPQRVNTEFIEISSPDRIKMRVWERGSGETLACGTGACASVVAGVVNGKTARKVTVELKGGELQIEWNALDNHVYLTGPASFVFEGETIQQ